MDQMILQKGGETPWHPKRTSRALFRGIASHCGRGLMGLIGGANPLLELLGLIGGTPLLELLGLIGGALTPLTADGPNDFAERRRDPLVSEAHEQGIVPGHCQPLRAEWLTHCLARSLGKTYPGVLFWGIASHCRVS
jgi:hypothetical protein